MARVLKTRVCKKYPGFESLSRRFKQYNKQGDIMRVYCSDKKSMLTGLGLNVLSTIAFIVLTVVVVFASIASVALIISKLFGISFWTACILVLI